jgi:hypothetical protein
LRREQRGEPPLPQQMGDILDQRGVGPALMSGPDA